MATKKILIGFLLLGALVIFALATFYIENWQFYIREGYRLDARFDRVLELSAGDEIRIAGVEVGRVNSITVDPGMEKPVLVTMWIRKGVGIRASDIAIIRMRSIFGGSFVEIETADQEAPLLEDGETLATTSVGLGISEIAERSDRVLEEMLGALQEARGALQNLAAVSERLEKGEGTIGKLLADDAAYDELKETLEEAGRALAGLSSLTDGIMEGEGLAGMLLKDPRLAEQVKTAVSDLGSFAAILGEMSEGFQDSALGKLASDDELYMTLQRTLAQLEDATTAISQSRGTVGRLLNDPELYDKLNATVDGVQEMITEYREQSPVLTFVGAVFGAM